MSIKWVMICVLGLAAGGVRAAEPAKGGEPAKGVELLTEAQFESMLEKMGYAYTVSGREPGRWFQIKVHRVLRDESIDLSVSLRFSGNGAQLWGHVPLADLKPDHLANAAALQKLLEWNDAVGPSAFRINPKTKRLFMSQGCETRGMTPARFREFLDGLLDDVVTTRDAWNTTGWTAAVKK
jgi:hypothetical protein